MRPIQHNKKAQTDRLTHENCKINNKQQKQLKFYFKKNY